VHRIKAATAASAYGTIRTAPLGLTMLSLCMGSSAWILLVNTQHEVSALIAYISRAARIPGSSLVDLVTGAHFTCYESGTARSHA
jgi:hypothetical protein